MGHPDCDLKTRQWNEVPGFGEHGCGGEDTAGGVGVKCDSLAAILKWQCSRSTGNGTQGRFVGCSIQVDFERMLLAQCSVARSRRTLPLVAPFLTEVADLIHPTRIFSKRK